MLRLVLAVVILFFVFRYVWPHIRVRRIMKGERNAQYSRREWEKIKRQLRRK